MYFSQRYIHTYMHTYMHACIYTYSKYVYYKYLIVHSYDSLYVSVIVLSISNDEFKKCEQYKCDDMGVKVMEYNYRKEECHRIPSLHEDLHYSTRVDLLKPEDFYRVYVQADHLGTSQGPSTASHMQKRSTHQTKGYRKIL